MVKNEIYNNLTESQLEILAEVTKGKNLEDKAQLSNAIGDLYEMDREENFLNPDGISAEYEEDLNEVQRYLKSLGDAETMKKLLLEDIVKQKEIYSKFNDFDFFRTIHQLAQTYGFTDTEVENIAEEQGLVFKETTISNALLKEIIKVIIEGQEIVQGCTKFIYWYNDGTFATHKYWEHACFPDTTNLDLKELIEIKSHMRFFNHDELIGEIEAIFYYKGQLALTDEQIKYIKENYNIDEDGYIIKK